MPLLCVHFALYNTMIKTHNKNIKFEPLQRYRLGYLVAWDKQPMQYHDYDDEGNIIASHTSDTISTWALEYFDNKPTREQLENLFKDYYGESYNAELIDWGSYL